MDLGSNPVFSRTFCSFMESKNNYKKTREFFLGGGRGEEETVLILNTLNNKCELVKLSLQGNSISYCLAFSENFLLIPFTTSAFYALMNFVHERG